MKPTFAPQILTSRALIQLTGENVLAFLQGLLTCDVASLSPRTWAYGAMLSPQGKILHEVFVIHDSSTVWVDCVKAEREALLQRLTRYRLRAKITLATPAHWVVAAGLDRGLAAMDPRLPDMGLRAIVPESPLPTSGAYHTHRIALGLADGEADIGSDHMFPHEANFDQLRGVSFSKGCYVGQEVVARMQHRGTARNRILPVFSETELPETGSDIRSGETLLGVQLSSAGGFGLALIRTDRLVEAKAPLLAAGVRLHVQKPDWMKLDFEIPEVAE
ncbi:MAG: folate-binding protein [Hyphomicrobiales bacterium]